MGDAGRPAPAFGLCHDFRQRLPFTQDHAEFYAECLEEISAGDHLGFDAVWLSEHHFVDDGHLSSSLTVAAAIAARTQRIRIGTNIVTLPLHHPLRVAEDAAAVDLLSGGRFVLGVGQGYLPGEFQALGADLRQRPSRLEEGIAILAWERGRTGFTGRRWAFPDLPFEPRPSRPVPIYIGATSEVAVDRAFRLADGLLVYCATPEDFVTRYATFREVRDRHPERGHFPLVLTGVLYVDDDGDRAWEQAAPAIAYQEDQFVAWRSLLEAPADRPAPAPTGSRLRREDYLVGDPATVAAALVTLHRLVPFDQFAFWARLPGHTHEQALRSMRLFAAEVEPSVRRSMANR